MAERGITKADVEECLRRCVQKLDTAKIEYKGPVGATDRMLKVGVARDRDTDDEKFVTTVMWEDGGGR